MSIVKAASLGYKVCLLPKIDFERLAKSCISSLMILLREHFSIKFCDDDLSSV